MPSDFWPAVFSIAPTLLFGLLFWFIFRAMIRSDRTERRVRAKIEAEERVRMGLPPAPAPVE